MEEGQTRELHYNITKSLSSLSRTHRRKRDREGDLLITTLIARFRNPRTCFTIHNSVNFYQVIFQYEVCQYLLMKKPVSPVKGRKREVKTSKFSILSTSTSADSTLLVACKWSSLDLESTADRKPSWRLSMSP